MSRSHVPVIVVFPDGSETQYPNISDAAKDTGVKYTFMHYRASRYKGGGIRKVYLNDMKEPVEPKEPVQDEFECDFCHTTTPVRYYDSVEKRKMINYVTWPNSTQVHGPALKKCLPCYRQDIKRLWSIPI